MKNNSFLKSTLIFSVAGIFAKFLGIFFKIPLGYLAGDEGLGLYGYTYSLYITLLAISSAGIPIAISKMVSERVSRGRMDEATRAFKISITLLALAGGVMGLILILSRNLVINTAGWDREAVYSIYALAPAIFFVALMSAYRGYFQGLNNMIPTSVSLIIESFGRVFVGIGLTYLLLRSDYSLGVAIGGASFGATAGAIMGVISMVIMYRIHKKRDIPLIKVEIGARESVRGIIKTMLYIAIPISIAAAVSSLMSVIDSMMIPNRLSTLSIYTQTQITELWGMYGKALTMINVPVVFGVAISANMVPAISGSFSKGELEVARQKVLGGLKLAIILSLPSAVGLSLLSDGIIATLFPSNPEGGYILAIFAYSAVFMIMSQTFTSVLQGINRVMVPVYGLLVGGIVKIVLNYFLVANASLNINGASISSVIGYMSVALFNAIAVKRYLSVKFEYKNTFIKPILASIAMVFGIIAMKAILTRFISSVTINTLAGVGAGAIIYFVALLLLGTFNKEDLEMLPFGNKVVRFLTKIKVFS